MARRNLTLIWDEWYWLSLDSDEQKRLGDPCSACFRWVVGESEDGPSGFDDLRLVAMGSGIGV